MPSLREQFFKNNPIFYDAAGRLLLDTLAEELAAQRPPEVEAVEPEKHSCGECHYFEPGQERRCTVREGWMTDTFASSPSCSQFVLRAEPEDIDASIHELCKDLAEIRFAKRYWKQECEKARGQLAEAKAEIERLRESCRWWKSRCDNELLRRKEAERLLRNLHNSTELADARAEIELLQVQRDLERAAVMMGKPVGPEAEAEFERLKADAENWRLVLGMPLGTQLRKHWKSFDSMPIWMSFRWEGGPEGWDAKVSTDDPAEALRSIQEVADDEM